MPNVGVERQKEKIIEGRNFQILLWENTKNLKKKGIFSIFVKNTDLHGIFTKFHKFIYITIRISNTFKILTVLGNFECIANPDFYVDESVAFGKYSV